VSNVAGMEKALWVSTVSVLTTALNAALARHGWAQVALVIFLVPIAAIWGAMLRPMLPQRWFAAGPTSRSTQSPTPERRGAPGT
jgi:hypothetical protein